MLRLATSSWTLHNTLGQVWYEQTGNGKAVNKGPEMAAMPLLDLPAFVAADGIDMLEIVHFHFPSTEDSYLAELKAALDEANVELANVLVDTGNLSCLDDAQWQADLEMTKGWQAVAAKLGAGGNRIDCGTEAATPETMQRSATALQMLAEHGSGLGLTTTTENWRTTSLQPENLFEIMDQVQHPLKLCVDFGNASKTEDKYATLAALLPYGNSLHCKGVFNEDGLDMDEFHRALGLVKEANFDGHIALIYDGYDDEWEKVLTLKERVEEFFSEFNSSP